MTLQMVFSYGLIAFTIIILSNICLNIYYASYALRNPYDVRDSLLNRGFKYLKYSKDYKLYSDNPNPVCLNKHCQSCSFELNRVYLSNISSILIKTSCNKCSYSYYTDEDYRICVVTKDLTEEFWFEKKSYLKEV